jgi:hypothetical protein
VVLLSRDTGTTRETGFGKRIILKTTDRANHQQQRQQQRGRRATINRNDNNNKTFQSWLNSKKQKKKLNSDIRQIAVEPRRRSFSCFWNENS